MDDLLSDFLTETNEGLSDLDVALVKLERTPDDGETLSLIFRLVHTIKGTCGFLGLPRLEHVAHAAENVLGKVRDGVLTVTPDMISLVLKAVDQIKAILAGLAATGSEPAGDDADLVAALNATAAGQSAPQRSPALTAAAPKADDIGPVPQSPAEPPPDAVHEINSIGASECRPAFRAALVEWGRAHWNELCEDCHNRIERNPLRLLDCKIDAKLAESAPSSLDYLCDACRAHFDTVKELLTGGGRQFVVNPRMVRGLDYYTRTAFEVMAGGLGAQSTVVGGGRYDGLVETMGGAAVAGNRFRDRRRSDGAGSGSRRTAAD